MRKDETFVKSLNMIIELLRKLSILALKLIYLVQVSEKITRSFQILILL